MRAKQKIFAVALACLLLLSSAGCRMRTEQTTRPTVDSQELQFETPRTGDTVAVFQTSEGEFRVLLYPELAPQAYDNFVGMVQSGYYDGMLVNRVENGFVVEAGRAADRSTRTLWGSQSYPAEYTDKLHHYSGAFCMATNEGGSVNSVFYIVDTATDSVSEVSVNKMRASNWREDVIDAYRKAGGAPYLDYTDTVLGQVYQGMDVVDKIGQAETDGEGTPQKAIVLKSVTIETYA